MRFTNILKYFICFSTIYARPGLRLNRNTISQNQNSPSAWRVNDIGNGDYMQEVPILLPRDPKGGLEFFFLRKILKSRNPWKKNIWGGHLGGQKNNLFSDLP